MKIGKTAEALLRAASVLSPAGNAALLMLATTPDKPGEEGSSYEAFDETLRVLWRLADTAEREE